LTPHFDKLIAMYQSAPINDWFQPRMSIPEAGVCQVELNVRREFFHAAAAIHGAVYFKMLDDAAFFAVQSLVHDVFVLTASFNLYFLRPVSAGELVSQGRVVHRTKRLFIAEAVLMQKDGKEVGRGSGNFLPSSTPLAADLGYR